VSGYELTPRAEEGLLRIVNYVEQQFGTRVTDRVLDSIESALLGLAQSPLTGHVRQDLTGDESIRFWSVGPTLIAYRFHSSPIEVLFIERGDLDWKRLLGDLL
tara:strand:+ start:293 stop:601 length:309 start_codon:yes stop_codon:yes gene_type:complete